MKDQREGAARKIGVPESDEATCISSFLYLFAPFFYLSFLYLFIFSIFLCLVLLT